METLSENFLTGCFSSWAMLLRGRSHRGTSPLSLPSPLNGKNRRFWKHLREIFEKNSWGPKTSDIFAPSTPSDCTSTAEREAGSGSIGCTAGMRKNHAGILFGKAIQRAARPCADPSNRDGWLSQETGLFEKPFCTGGRTASFHGVDQRGPRHI